MAIATEIWTNVTRKVGVRTCEDRRMLYPYHRVGERKHFSRRSKASGYNGQTAFYRLMNAQHQTIEWAAAQNSPLRMLLVASSIGCDPYTYSMLAHNAGANITIDAFDISDEFTRIAKAGVYPIEALIGLPEELKQHFAISSDEKFATVKDYIKERVNFLPHSSLKRFRTEKPYDIVVSHNFLKHIYNNIWFESGGNSRFRRNNKTGEFSVVRRPEKQPNHNRDPKRHARQSPQAHAITKLCALTSNMLFVDMIEETPFVFYRESPPFNPFEEAGMIYLDGGLRPFMNGERYPTNFEEAKSCFADRNLVHAFQRPQI